MEPKEEFPYEDMLNLTPPISVRHAKMSIEDRAAQFSPFAALTGYDSAIKETGRLTDQRVELDEAAKSILDEKLSILQHQTEKQPEVVFEYFQRDQLKMGGTYCSIRGTLKKIDAYQRIVVMRDGMQIPVEDIVNITGDIFREVDDSNLYML